MLFISFFLFFLFLFFYSFILFILTLWLFWLTALYKRLLLVNTIATAQRKRYSVQQHSTKEQLSGTPHAKLAPVISKEKQQKPVFTSKPKNTEIRTKDEHRYSFQSENKWQPIRIHYFNFCQDRTVHRI